jgi:hypothetical protein
LKHCKVHIKTHRLHFIKMTLLVTLLIYLSFTHYSLRQGNQIDDGEPSPTGWLQPALLDVSFEQLIGNDSWRLDYNIIEQILWMEKQNASGKLIIDSATADRLQQASDLLPQSMRPNEWLRLNFLMEKSLSGGAGQQFFSLLKGFYQYQQDYAASLSVIKQTINTQKLSSLRSIISDNRRRQAQYFGVEIAEQLFAKSNITTDYLTQRRIVNMDLGLTNLQKKQQLRSLEKNYKKMLNKQ